MTIDPIAQSCSRCGAALGDDSRFCPKCGLAVEGASSDAATTAGGDATRLAAHHSGERAAEGPGPSANRGWLSSSGSIDHGRFPPGTILDQRYRVIGLVGRGGMGEVFRADDLRLGQPVALKFLPDQLAHDPVRLAQFHNEVRTARQVSHPNVCRVYDIGDVGGQLFLTMEYVDGEDLASLIRRIGRLPEDKTLEIARQICAGLAAAHERGVLHRDLKPANIMLDGTGRVRVMDFGLAAVGEVTDIRAGTPAYMAPEQLAGREVTVRSDIYALGLVLYELFTGRRAFTAASIAELVAQHDSGTITAPTELVKTLDPTIERAILRCMDPDPARRPASALAVAAALPGGDPLAAALAAGETPSPQMVAAAGGESATLSPRAGVAWLFVTVALVVAVVAVTQRVSILSRISFAKPAVVLADRAENLRRAIGYTDAAHDTASGITSDDDYAAWGRRHGAAAANWADLAAPGVAPIRFWYRTSPIPLVPTSTGGNVSSTDPPLAMAGMTRVVLDPAGRLVSFAAVPPQVESAPAGGAPPSAQSSWDALFTAAGLDVAAFTPVAPSRTPPVYADARAAWRGTLPGSTTPITVEAASYRGKPVMFDIVAPWTAASRDPGAAADTNSLANTVIVLVLLAISVMLTRLNLRSGRADRTGAFRLAAFMFWLFVTEWVLLPHLHDANAEEQRLFVRIGVALFIAGALYVIYLALEPIVRKGWPRALVTWSRMLAGRVRDPLVGRDVIVGVAAGLVLAVGDRIEGVVEHLAGAPFEFPHVPTVSALAGGSAALLTLGDAVNVGLQNALITFLMFALAREGLRRVFRRLSDRWVVAGAIVTLTALMLVQNVGQWQVFWIGALFLTVYAGVAVVLMMRLGLFAAVIMFFVETLLGAMPLTFDGSRLYASESWAAAALVVALAAVGFWLARAGEPLFGPS